MGILGTSDYVECSASDLIGQYVGQTGPKTQNKLTEALGRVLFVDEAYRFCDGAFGKEAVNELVDCLTKPAFMGKIVVILAGYTHQIDELLQINPGLSSRFPEEVVFENMAPEKCLELLQREIKKQEIDIAPPMDCTSPAEHQQMLGIFTELSKLPSWGNGRDVINIAKSICSDAFAGNTSSGLTVSVSDIMQHLEKTFKSLSARNDPRKDSLSPDHFFKYDPLATLTRDPPKAPTHATATVTKTKTAEPTPVEEGAPQDEQNPKEARGSAPQRDPGVSDQTWQRLQNSIAEERALKQADEMFIAAQQHELQARKDAEEAVLQEIARLTEEKRLADEKRYKEIEEELREEKRRIEETLRARREAEEKLRKAREEAERKKREELAVQKKIRDMGVCPVGFRWVKTGGGYQCTGGSHFLSDSQLGI
jgi:hypothetical protein